MEKKQSSDSLTQDLQELFNQIESGRLKALNDLREIQIIGQTLFQNEANRLNQKLGQDHPRVQQLEAQLQDNFKLVNDVEVAMEVARIRVPEVGENDGLVHGRVADENRRGLTDLTVYAEDETGQAIRSLGTAKTDSSGYYALQVDAGTVAGLSEVGGIYLVVADETGEIVHRESAPLTLAEGARVVVGVTLKREDLIPAREPWEPSEQRPPSGGGDEEILDAWVGRGRVVDESGQALDGLLVRLFDRDRRYDDKLGAALTNKDGDFTIAYRVQDFREGAEPGPDLYLMISDKEGTILYTSKEAVRFDAGRIEVFDVTISRKTAEGDEQSSL